MMWPDDLVAGGKHDQAVQLMGLDHDLNAVLDQLAAGKGVPHALMAHGNSIADSYGLKFERHASSRANARLHSLAQPVQMDVAGYKIIEGVDDSDEGTADLFIA